MPSSPSIRPFIIWTQRRTGGTTLTSLLVTLSGLPFWQDEAFNADRELGAISRDFEDTGDAATMAARVAAALAERRILKHTLETVPWPVSRAVLRHSQAQGYRQLVLLRRDETERQVSLALAELTGIWGPEAAAARYPAMLAGQRRLPPLDLDALHRQINADAAMLGRLLRTLIADQVAYRMVFFEDFFTGDAAARHGQFETLACHLGLPPRPSDDPLVAQALMGRAQHTEAIHALVPNLAEAMALIGLWS